MSISETETKLVRTLQSPGAIVTYRIITGAFGIILLALVSFMGSRIIDGITNLQASMVQVQIAVTHNSGRMDGIEARVSHNEGAIDKIDDGLSGLDHRVTVIESRGH